MMMRVDSGAETPARHTSGGAWPERAKGREGALRGGMRERRARAARLSVSGEFGCREFA